MRQRKRGVVHCDYASVLSLFVGWRTLKKRLLASLVATAGNAGQRAECRDKTEIEAFHASTSCVICLWRREEFAG